MLIKLSPIRSDGPRLALDVAGNGTQLVINNEIFDLSPMGVGDTLPVAAITSTWFAGDVERDDAGEIVATLYFPHGADAPHDSRFPLPISVSVDGPVALPPADGYTTPTSEGEVTE